MGSQIYTQESPAGRKNLVAIRPECLQAESMADFDIFVRFDAESDPVLYREKHLPIRSRDLEALQENAEAALLIDSDDEALYFAYVAENLRGILTNNALPVSERSTLLYKSAAQLMHDVMQEPRAKGLLETSVSVANEAVDFMAGQSSVFEHLLKVASFDYYTYTHSMNVFMYSVALAQRTCIECLDELRAFGQAALLHDLGKGMVGKDALQCAGPLDDDQWRRMKLHPVHGFDLLADRGFLCERGLRVVRHHHEKLCGGGYPDGIGGDQIGPWVRVTTICDIFDALTTRRSYKDALETFPALTLMRDTMRDDLDYGYFQCFVKMMGERAA